MLLCHHANSLSSTLLSFTSTTCNVCRLFDLCGGSRRVHKKKENEKQFREYYADTSSVHTDKSGFRAKGEDNDVFRQTNAYETLRVSCEINGHHIQAVIDTGAQISIMSTKFAKNCDLYSSIDRRFAGRAVGVGSSEILGSSTSQVRLGAMQFKSDFSVLENTRVDLIIGLDILRKYQCDICLRENVVKLHYHNKVFRVPIISPSNPMMYGTCEHDGMVRKECMDKSSVISRADSKSFSCHYEEDDGEDEENHEAVSMEGW